MVLYRAMTPDPPASITQTLILGSIMLFVGYIIGFCGNRRRSAHPLATFPIPADIPKFNSPRRPPFNSEEMPDVKRVRDWIKSESLSMTSAKDTEEEVVHTRRWILSPKKARVTQVVNESNQGGRPPIKGRWKGQPANTFFPSQARDWSNIGRTNIDGKIKKPGGDFLKPAIKPHAQPGTDWKKPFPQNCTIPQSKPPNPAPLRPPQKAGQDWTRYKALTMEQIDPIYEKICRILAGHLWEVTEITAGNLRWAAAQSQEPNKIPDIDWDSYLEYREQRAEAERRLRQKAENAPKIRSRDPYSLTKSQLNALAGLDFSTASVEDVYHMIAGFTARAEPTADFLTTVSRRYNIRTDIDWHHYLKHYLYRVKGPTTKSSSEATTEKPNSPTASKFARDKYGQAVDVLGNVIEYARNRVGNTTPELDIEITMTGALHPDDAHSAENPKRRIAKILADTPSIADVRDEANPQVQPWRLIKGTKLPHKRIRRHKHSVYDIRKPFVDKLLSLNPPVRLDEYWISKKALLTVMNLRDQLLNRNPYNVNLRHTKPEDLTDTKFKELMAHYREIDAQTIRMLIAFGGRFQTAEEIDAAAEKNRLDLDYGWYPENLQPLKLFENRGFWTRAEQAYWKELDVEVGKYWKRVWERADMYWQVDVGHIIQASMIIGKVDPPPEAEPVGGK